MYLLITLTLFASPVTSQFAMNTGMRADVTFDDRNERFDVSDMIRSHNKLFRTQPIDPQTSGETDKGLAHSRRSNLWRYRRNRHKSLRSKPLSKSRRELLNQIKMARTEQLNRVLNDALLRIHSGRRDFAYHDEMVSNSDNEGDFNTNLNKFRANVKETSENLEDVQDVLSKLARNGRRSIPVEDQRVLMHYAFPVKMRVQGFLQSQ